MEENTQNPAPPAAPTIPPGFIDVTSVRERDLEYMDQSTADQIRLAQAAARESKRAAKAAADEKAAKESAESNQRVKDAMDELVKKDADTPEEEKPEGDGQTPVEIEVKNVSAEHRAEAEQFALDVGAIAADTGIPAEEAQTIFDFAVDLGLMANPGIDLTNKEACANELSMKYGSQAPAIVIAAQAAVRRLGKDVAAYLNHTGLGNDPGVLLALAEFNNGTTKLSKDAATKELTKLRASKEFQSGDRYAVDRGRLLSAIAYRGDSNEVKVPAKAAPVAKSASQAELAKLRLDPAYFDKYAANHKAVVARVGELMAQLHPEG